MISPPTKAAAQPTTVALFVSDIHLHESLPKTTAAFLDFLLHHARNASQLYLLGDLFEYWAGDDDMANPYNRQVVDALRRLSDAGVALYWIAGNRDFLVGEAFARATGITLLPDPHVTTIAGQRITLTHGDAQCTDDVGYMAFRNQVRAPLWQQAFLDQPLAQRKAIIEGMRDQSRVAQQSKSCEIMDVNQAAISTLFAATESSVMIHGHTHRPARHQTGQQDDMQVRYVLPDWDCDVDPPRGGWIAASSDGVIMQHDLNGHEQK